MNRLEKVRKVAAETPAADLLDVALLWAQYRTHQARVQQDLDGLKAHQLVNFLVALVTDQARRDPDELRMMRRALELYHQKVLLCLGLAWGEARQCGMLGWSGEQPFIERADQLMGLPDSQLEELVARLTGRPIGQLWGGS